MANGRVKWFNATKRYGFIQSDDGGADVFVHITELKNAGIDDLNEGQRLSFDTFTNNNGKISATNLKLHSN